MGLSLQDVVVLTVAVLPFLAVAKGTSPHKRRLPPGPTPIPFLGNVFDIKADAPWISYTEMRETYGARSTSLLQSPES
jgi:hypothetical protein